MAIDQAEFNIEQLAVTPGAAVFTVDANTTYQVIQAVATNIDTTNATNITIQVNDGAGLTNYVVARTIPPGGSDLLPEITGRYFPAAYVLQAFASSASDINLSVSVKKIT